MRFFKCWLEDSKSANSSLSPNLMAGKFFVLNQLNEAEQKTVCCAGGRTTIDTEYYAYSFLSLFLHER